MAEEEAQGAGQRAQGIPVRDASRRHLYRVYNIGNHQPVELLRLIETLEDCLGQPVVKVFLPMQPGDVVATYADVEALTAAVGFRPETAIEEGVERFVGWYREFYNGHASLPL